MEIAKPSDADKERFRSLAPDDIGVEVKAMFGNLAATINGNMFMGLFGAQVGLKLPEDRRLALLALPGAGPFGPSDRPMREYATMPPGWDNEQAAPWIEEALTFVGAQPPKVKKPRKKKAK